MSEQTQKQNQTQEAPERESKAKKEIRKVPLDKYTQYTDLKFLVLDGAVLKESAQKELDSLEKELSTYSGMKPNPDLFKRNVVGYTASIGLNIVKLVKGIAVPDEIVELIKNHKGGDSLGFYLK